MTAPPSPAGPGQLRLIADIRPGRRPVELAGTARRLIALRHAPTEVPAVANRHLCSGEHAVEQHSCSLNAQSRQRPLRSRLCHLTRRLSTKIPAAWPHIVEELTSPSNSPKTGDTHHD
jgi:hypothetical protein